MQPFCPALALTQTISATQANTPVTLTAVGANLDQIRIVNAGPNTVFWRFGSGAAQTADPATDTPVLSGGTEVFSTGTNERLAFICNPGQTATVYVTPGLGE